MELLAGLVLFTLGLGAFVFPRQVTRVLGDALDRELGHRAIVGIRASGVLAAAVGFWLLL